MKNQSIAFDSLSGLKGEDIVPSETSFDAICLDRIGSCIFGLEDLDVDNLLEDAEAVVRTDDYLIPDPTPISPCNINIVDHASLTAVSWYNDKSLSSSIYTLLASPKVPKYLNTTGLDVNNGNESIVARLPSQDHSERWNERYQDLIQFHRVHKHCLVPSTYPCNPRLGHWVKRQRYQYNLKINGCHSTLTTEREEALEKLGFVWDSHAAIWEERCNELLLFQECQGHCHVPRRYPENPKLPIWIKCQRRQYKLFVSGRGSTMTQDRINKLQRIGLMLDPRNTVKR